MRSKTRVNFRKAHDQDQPVQDGSENMLMRSQSVAILKNRVNL